MRIVLLTYSFPKTTETFIVQDFLGLAAHGWDVRVACFRCDPEELDRFPALRRPDLRRRICAFWPRWPRWLWPVWWLRSLALCLASNPRAVLRSLSRGLGGARIGSWLRQFPLEMALARIRPALVHFEFGTLGADFGGIAAALGARVVVSFRGHDLDFVDLEDPRRYDEVWRSADAVHLIGEHLRTRALQRGCPATKPLALIHPGVDCAYFRRSSPRAPGELGTEARPLRVLCVGRLSWAKGHEFALQAIKAAMDRGLRCDCRIIGDGESRDSVLFARRQLGLEGSVQVLGAGTHAEVRSQMEWADVFLHAAVVEGFCNAVAEAQAMGLAVVSSDAGGLVENVLDGVTGLVARRRDWAGLAERLVILARDPLLRERLGREARRRAERSLAFEAHMEAFERLYREVLEGRGRTTAGACAGC